MGLGPYCIGISIPGQAVYAYASLQHRNGNRAQHFVFFKLVTQIDR